MREGPAKLVKLEKATTTSIIFLKEVHRKTITLGHARRSSAPCFNLQAVVTTVNVVSGASCLLESCDGEPTAASGDPQK
jgi:hypothetical protein